MFKPKERKKLFLVFGMALMLMLVLVASQAFGYRPPDPQSGLMQWNAGGPPPPLGLCLYHRILASTTSITANLTRMNVGPVMEEIHQAATTTLFTTLSGTAFTATQ